MDGDRILGEASAEISADVLEAARSLLPTGSPEAGPMILARIIHAARTALIDPISVDQGAVTSVENSPQEALSVLAALDQTSSAICALQAEWSVAAEDRIVAERRAQGCPARDLRRGVPHEIALAQRTSPARCGLSLAASRRLIRHLPRLHAHLSDGRIPAAQARCVATSLDGAPVELLAAIDEELGGHPARLDGLGKRETTDLVRTLACSLDSSEIRRRAERALRNRRVEIHPEADGMGRLVAHLPAVQLAVIGAALRSGAEARRRLGCPGTTSTHEADVLVDLVRAGMSAGTLLGYDLLAADAVNDPVDANEESSSASPAPARSERANEDALELRAPVPGEDPMGDTVAQHRAARASHRIELGIVISDRALTTPGTGESARIEGYGRVPADALRLQLTDPPPGSPVGPGRLPDPDPLATAFYRRLYTHPVTGQLVAMESRARAFPVSLRRLIRWREVTCRMPWCNAPVRQIDHVQAHARGGATARTNAQGLCASCNGMKEMRGWRVEGSEGIPNDLVDEAPAPPPQDRGGIRWTGPHGSRGSSPTPPTHPGQRASIPREASSEPPSSAQGDGQLGS